MAKAKKSKKKTDKGGSNVEKLAREAGKMAARAHTLALEAADKAKEASVAVGNLVSHPSELANALATGGGRIGAGASQIADFVEKRLEEVINRLGLPGRAEFEDLAGKVKALQSGEETEGGTSKRAASRSAKPASSRAGARKPAAKKAAAKPAAKTATKKAAAKPAAKKAAAKPAAKKAAAKPAARKTAARRGETSAA